MEIVLDVGQLIPKRLLGESLHLPLIFLHHLMRLGEMGASRGGSEREGEKWWSISAESMEDGVLL